MNDILKTSTKETIDIVIQIVDDVLNIKDLKIKDIIVQTIKYLKGDKTLREELRIGQELELRWYKSVENGNPDFGVYDHPYYLAELVACWTIYSKEYIKNMNKFMLFPKDPKVIVDLGCGIGLSTLALKQLFPNAEVFGTNLKNTMQYSICNSIAEKNDFKIVESILDIPKDVDIVFASEYFEHISDPIKHLFDVIRYMSPKNLYAANSFNTKAIGHFPFYIVADELVENKKLGRIFGSEMRLHGYEKISTKLWNARPTYWKEINDE